MYTDSRKPIYTSDSTPNSLQKINQKSGVSVSFNTEASTINNYLIQQEDARDKNADINSNKLTLAYSTIHIFDKNALGYNIGFNTLSGNATLNVFSDLYLTVAYAPFENIESILQYPVLTINNNSTNHGGVAIGAFFKNYSFKYDSVPEELFDPSTNSVNINNYGGRIMMHFAAGDSFMFHGFTNIGYSPVLDTMLLKFGVTFGTSY